MIDTQLTRDIKVTVPCPVSYCKALKGQNCKTPKGLISYDLHTRRYGKFVRHLGAKMFKETYYR